MAARPFWYTNFTGVDAAERRRGVATALKSALLAAAHDAGAEAVVTHNDDTNDAILRLNESFGMVRGVGYRGMARPLAAPTP
jgi:RimJ/RimL family protein N-acetyltransferase